MTPAADVVAAGAVVLRRGAAGREVLLVHRDRYDDWSFPKGKLDRGEHVLSAAVREVEEETGVRVALGRPLAEQHYQVGAGTKRVHYWIGRAVGSDDVSRYQPNAEIDAVAWVGVEEAASLLTYRYDRATLEEALGVRKRTVPLLVVRHSPARARKGWRQDDRLRPLLKAGQDQAKRLAPLLAAYDVGRVVSSPSSRCVQTLAPYAARERLLLETESVLSEEGADPRGIAALAERLIAETVEKRLPTALCSHRPVLPEVLRALGAPDVRLETGEVLVLHLRAGTVRATERHRPS